MKRIAAYIMISLLLFSVPEAFIFADDDEYEKYEEHEDDEHDYERYEEDDDHDDEYYQKPKYSKIHREYWYKWSRSSIKADEFARVPITTEEFITVQAGNKQSKTMKVFPLQGQLFVPIQETASYLGAYSHVYDKSKIVEILLGHNQLIVKANSIVAYENMEKVPMPAPTMYKENTLYMPVSVLANALGYSVSWSNQKGLLFIGGSF